MKRVLIVGGRRLNAAELVSHAQCEVCHSSYPRDKLNWQKKIQLLLDDDTDPEHYFYSGFISCPHCKTQSVSDCIVKKRRKSRDFMS